MQIVIKSKNCPKKWRQTVIAFQDLKKSPVKLLKLKKIQLNCFSVAKLKIRKETETVGRSGN